MELTGVELFQVGGMVRDMLLGRESNDKDYVALTKLSFKEVVGEIEKQGRVFQAKEEFLTIRCSLGDEVIDIALPRTEGDYEDNRRPSTVLRAETLKEDSSRRDFTINAMYYNEKDGVIDYHNGKDDITRKRIRTVGNPEDRFGEDYLRILRGVRLAVSLGFTIEDRTFKAMKKLASKIGEVDMNRVRQELTKALNINARTTLHYLNELDLWEVINSHGLRFIVTNKLMR